MKKLIISLFVVMVSLVGIGGVTAGSANAVTCPYSGCVGTKTAAHASSSTFKRGARDYIHIRVAPRSGTASPRGTIRLVCTGPGARHIKTRSYYGHAITMYVRLWARGTWTCTAHFASAYKWRASSGSTSFRVVRR